VSGLNTRAEILLGQMQDLFGADNVIGVSGHRDSSSTDHGRGDAIDFSVKGLNSEQIAQQVLKSNVLNEGFDQLIYYNGSTHLHIGTGETTGRMRGQILEATKGKVTTYVNKKASDLIGKAKGKAVEALGNFSRNMSKSAGNPVVAGAMTLGNAIGIGGGGKSIFQQFVDYIKETGFFTRAAMVAIGIVLVIAALGWLGKSKLPVANFAGAIKGK